MGKEALELADLLGIINIQVDSNIDKYDLKKRKETIYPTVKDELKGIGTEDKLTKLPAGTVIVNNTLQAQKQPIYVQPNRTSKATKKSEPMPKIDVKLNEAEIIKPELESIVDSLCETTTGNMKDNKKREQKT